MHTYGDIDYHTPDVIFFYQRDMISSDDTITFSTYGIYFLSILGIPMVSPQPSQSRTLRWVIPLPDPRRRRIARFAAAHLGTWPSAGFAAKLKFQQTSVG